MRDMCARERIALTRREKRHREKPMNLRSGGNQLAKLRFPDVLCGTIGSRKAYGEAVLATAETKYRCRPGTMHPPDAGIGPALVFMRFASSLIS
jgi:hypothetical protein